MPVARPETSDSRVIAHVDMDCFYVQGPFLSLSLNFSILSLSVCNSALVFVRVRNCVNGGEEIPMQETPISVFWLKNINLRYPFINVVALTEKKIESSGLYCVFGVLFSILPMLKIL